MKHRNSLVALVIGNLFLLASLGVALRYDLGTLVQLTGIAGMAALTLLMFVAVMLESFWTSATWYVFGTIISTILFLILALANAFSATGAALLGVLYLFTLVVIGRSPVKKQRKRRQKQPTQQVNVVQEKKERVLMGSENGSKVHTPQCMIIQRTAKKNRVAFNSLDDAVKQGYMPCKVCSPDKE